MPHIAQGGIKRADACGIFDKICCEADKSELLIDDQDWPLPKYRELLFLR